MDTAYTPVEIETFRTTNTGTVVDSEDEESRPMLGNDTFELLAGEPVSFYCWASTPVI
jgi:hypothetical protein